MRRHKSQRLHPVGSIASGIRYNDDMSIARHDTTPTNLSERDLSIIHLALIRWQSDVEEYESATILDPQLRIDDSDGVLALVDVATLVRDADELHTKLDAIPADISERQLAIIRAALRYWRYDVAEYGYGTVVDPEYRMDSSTGALALVEAGSLIGEIDELCERLNYSSITLL